MCYGFVPVENPTSFVLKSPQKILHKIRPYVFDPRIRPTGRHFKYFVQFNLYCCTPQWYVACLWVWMDVDMYVYCRFGGALVFE